MQHAGCKTQCRGNQCSQKVQYQQLHRSHGNKLMQNLGHPVPLANAAGGRKVREQDVSDSVFLKHQECSDCAHAEAAGRTGSGWWRTPEALESEKHVSWRRRKQREAKKYGKQVMAEVRKERAASKRANVDSMTKLRKQREKRCVVAASPGPRSLAAATSQWLSDVEFGLSKGGVKRPCGWMTGRRQ